MSSVSLSRPQLESKVSQNDILSSTRDTQTQPKIKKVKHLLDMSSVSLARPELESKIAQNDILSSTRDTQTQPKIKKIKPSLIDCYSQIEATTNHSKKMQVSSSMEDRVCQIHGNLVDEFTQSLEIKPIQTIDKQTMEEIKLKINENSCQTARMSLNDRYTMEEHLFTTHETQTPAVEVKTTFAKQVQVKSINAMNDRICQIVKENLQDEQTQIEQLRFNDRLCHIDLFVNDSQVQTATIVERKPIVVDSGYYGTITIYDSLNQTERKHYQDEAIINEIVTSIEKSIEHVEEKMVKSVPKVEALPQKKIQLSDVLCLIESDVKQFAAQTNEVKYENRSVGVATSQKDESSQLSIEKRVLNDKICQIIDQLIDQETQIVEVKKVFANSQSQTSKATYEDRICAIDQVGYEATSQTPAIVKKVIDDRMCQVTEQLVDNLTESLEIKTKIIDSQMNISYNSTTQSSQTEVKHIADRMCQIVENLIDQQTQLEAKLTSTIQTQITPERIVFNDRSCYLDQLVSDSQVQTAAIVQPKPIVVDFGIEKWSKTLDGLSQTEKSHFADRSCYLDQLVSDSQVQTAPIVQPKPIVIDSGIEKWSSTMEGKSQTESKKLYDIKTLSESLDGLDEECQVEKRPLLHELIHNELRIAVDNEIAEEKAVKSVPKQEALPKVKLSDVLCILESEVKAIAAQTMSTSYEDRSAGVATLSKDVSSQLSIVYNTIDSQLVAMTEKIVLNDRSSVELRSFNNQTTQTVEKQLQTKETNTQKLQLEVKTTEIGGPILSDEITQSEKLSFEVIDSQLGQGQIIQMASSQTEKVQFHDQLVFASQISSDSASQTAPIVTPKPVVVDFGIEKTSTSKESNAQTEKTQFRDQSLVMTQIASDSSNQTAPIVEVKPIVIDSSMEKTLLNNESKTQTEGLQFRDQSLTMDQRNNDSSSQTAPIVTPKPVVVDFSIEKTLASTEKISQTEKTSTHDREALQTTIGVDRLCQIDRQSILDHGFQHEMSIVTIDNSIEELEVKKAPKVKAAPVQLLEKSLVIDVTQRDVASQPAPTKILDAQLYLAGEIVVNNSSLQTEITSRNMETNTQLQQQLHAKLVENSSHRLTDAVSHISGESREIQTQSEKVHINDRQCEIQPKLLDMSTGSVSIQRHSKKLQASNDSVDFMCQISGHLLDKQFESLSMKMIDALISQERQQQNERQSQTEHLQYRDQAVVIDQHLNNSSIQTDPIVMPKPIFVDKSAEKTLVHSDKFYQTERLHLQDEFSQGEKQLGVERTCQVDAPHVSLNSRQIDFVASVQTVDKFSEELFKQGNGQGVQTISTSCADRDISYSVKNISSAAQSAAEIRPSLVDIGGFIQTTSRDITTQSSKEKLLDIQSVHVTANLSNEGVQFVRQSNLFERPTEAQAPVQLNKEVNVFLAQAKECFDSLAIAKMDAEVEPMLAPKKAPKQKASQNVVENFLENKSQFDLSDRLDEFQIKRSDVCEQSVMISPTVDTQQIGMKDQLTTNGTQSITTELQNREAFSDRIVKRSKCVQKGQVGHSVMVQFRVQAKTNEMASQTGSRLLVDTGLLGLSVVSSSRGEQISPTLQSFGFDAATSSALQSVTVDFFVPVTDSGSSASMAVAQIEKSIDTPRVMNLNDRMVQHESTSSTVQHRQESGVVEIEKSHATCQTAPLVLPAPPPPPPKPIVIDRGLQLETSTIHAFKDFGSFGAFITNEQTTQTAAKPPKPIKSVVDQQIQYQSEEVKVKEKVVKVTEAKVVDVKNSEAIGRSPPFPLMDQGWDESHLHEWINEEETLSSRAAPIQKQQQKVVKTESKSTISTATQCELISKELQKSMQIPVVAAKPVVSVRDTLLYKSIETQSEANQTTNNQGGKSSLAKEEIISSQKQQQHRHSHALLLDQGIAYQSMEIMQNHPTTHNLQQHYTGTISSIDSEMIPMSSSTLSSSFLRPEDGGSIRSYISLEPTRESIRSSTTIASNSTLLVDPPSQTSTLVGVQRNNLLANSQQQLQKRQQKF